MSLEALKNDIKKGTLHRVYLFWGPEEYLISYYLKEFETRIVNPVFKSFNYIMLEGKVSMGKIIENCEVAPVMSDKKMIVMKNTGAFVPESKGKKTKESSEFTTELSGYLQKIPENVCLIFVESQVNKKSSAFKTIDKLGLSIEFAYQGAPELARWVANIFAGHNIRIGKSDAEYLINICNPGMNDILNEVNKLIECAGEKNTVTREHIDSLCIKSVQSKVFEMIDSITQGNYNKAYSLLNDMILLKEPMQKISVLVARHFKMLYYVKRMMLEGNRVDRIAAELNIQSFIASKYIKQCEKYDIDVIRRAFAQCLEMDRLIKTGKIDPRIALETQIANYSN